MNWNEKISRVTTPGAFKWYYQISSSSPYFDCRGSFFKPPPYSKRENVNPPAISDEFSLQLNLTLNIILKSVCVRGGGTSRGFSTTLFHKTWVCIRLSKKIEPFKLANNFMIFTRIWFGHWKNFLSRDHDSQKLGRHVNKLPRMIQKRYMYIELDELFVTWPWRAEFGASYKQTSKCRALSNNVT